MTERFGIGPVGPGSIEEMTAAIETRVAARYLIECNRHFKDRQ